VTILEGTVVQDALNVLRSLFFFTGLIVANLYILLHRKTDSAEYLQDQAEGTAA
jgi:hypothetical protein